MFSLEGYQAVHANGGVVRRTDRRVLAVSGADRASWLQGLLTNDVASLAEGQSRYAAYLTPQGRMIADMNVVSREGRLLLDVPANLAAGLRDRLDGLIFAEDVQVTDESGRLLVWTVIGDQLTDLIGESLPAEFKSLPEVDLDTFEVIRIERGVPRFLADMDEDTLPLEAGIEDRAISFTKGCYVGQEIIIRVLHRGHGRVARKLVGLMLDPGASAPARGAGIASGSREIGAVTSAVESPDLGRPIALGYVHRDFVQPGTAVEIAGIPASVAALPFIPVTPLI
jgi:folate-binding protein YgfZ